MPQIRIEWVPISVYRLGLLGFDHLQLVYQQDETDPLNVQDEWYVIEGLFTSGPNGTSVLDADGIDGRTTLSEANQDLFGDDLVAAIGAPVNRGTRALPVLDAFATWEAMAYFAREFHYQQLPYRAFGPPAALVPTINSSSVIGSLLHYAGLDPAQHMPYGIRMSPGITTLLGTRANDHMVITGGFNALFGGHGNDTFEGANNSNRADRFYGGLGNDRFQWSEQFNIYHGGQVDLAYAQDGTDTVDYAGASLIYIRANPHVIEQVTPNLYVTTPNGFDHLYSIERVEWNAGSDHIALGPGVELIEDGLIFGLGQQSSLDQGDVMDFSAYEHALLVTAGDGVVLVEGLETAAEDRGLWVESLEWIVGSQHGDHIYLSGAMRGAQGGDGADLIDGRTVTTGTADSPNGYDVELYGDAGDDTIVSGTGRTYVEGGAGADQFVLSAMTAPGAEVELVIADADASDTLYVAYDFFDGAGGGFDGSMLMRIAGALAQFAGQECFADLPQNTGPVLGEGGIYRDDMLYFEWRLESEIRDNPDVTQGQIFFSGEIGFNRDGDDLLIHLYRSFRGSIASMDLAGTETIIRIVDFEDGDLGIDFHPIGPVEFVEMDDFAVLHRPGHDEGVQALTSGIFAPALAPRPTAPVQNPLEEGEPPAPPPVTAGTPDDDTITLTNAAADVAAGDGDDAITTGAAGDTLDGGAGADTLTGGAGDDLYVVDTAADLVVEELAGGGEDTVVASIDWTLADAVENLTLTGEAASGTGNERDNAMVGTAAANTLAGHGGDDTFYAAEGDDTIAGGAGSDGYIYVRGDGDDVVVDTGGAADEDVLILTGDVRPGEALVYLDPAAPSDIVIRVQGGGSIRVRDFLDETSGIDAVWFDDGTIWSRADIMQRAGEAQTRGNVAPLAADDAGFGVQAGHSGIPREALLANDSDIDGDVLAIVSVDAVSAGSASIDAEGNVWLTTPDDYEGVVTMTYTIADGNGGTASATAEILVLANPSSAPVPGQLLVGTAGADSLVGSAGDDTIDGGSGDDTLVGAGGNDTFVILGGDDGFDVYDGGDGVDAIVGSQWNDVVALASVAGNLAGIESIDGGDGHDVLRLTAGADVLDLTGITLTGIELIDTGAGADTLIGSAGSDVIEGAGGDDSLDGGGGNDTFHCVGGDDGVDILRGGAGQDTVLGSQWNDVLGLAGVTGNLDGIETIDLGGGHDVIRLTSGADVLDLTMLTVVAVELIDGGAGADSVTGSAGSDTIEGGGGDDVLNGGDGADRFVVVGGASGVDAIHGGDGDDIIQGSIWNDIIGLSALEAVESIDGGLGTDTLRLTAGADVLDLTFTAVTSVELIDAGAGNDIVLGSAGGDIIEGGSGNDALIGGFGDDVFRVVGDDGFDAVDGGDGFDRIQGSAWNDVIGIDGLQGGGFNGIELIEGGSGTDVIRLTGGSDQLDLSQSMVTGVELIDGGAGHDLIIASLSADTIRGGAGSDIFAFRPGFGHDVVLDFQIGSSPATIVDSIDLSGNGIADFADLLAHASQVGADTVIALDPASSIRLVNIQLAQLREQDFMLG